MKKCCERCNGTGYTEHKHILFGLCLSCLGTGYVYLEIEQRINCPICKGKGRLNPKHEKPRTCYLCKGKGYFLARTLDIEGRVNLNNILNKLNLDIPPYLR